MLDDQRTAEDVFEMLKTEVRRDDLMIQCVRENLLLNGEFSFILNAFPFHVCIFSGNY